jgi:CheY-like chemotaxis protein
VSYKILLADDSVTVQKIITLTFSDEGVDVVTVNNGDEAINRLQYMRPALVMADVSIPGRNGYDICEFVKDHPEMKETPVILLVPAFEPFDEARARRIGADYHLTKPFQSIRTLISTVKSLIERRAVPEFSVSGSGLTAIQSPDQAVLEAAEVDPKRAKIEELIKLSAQPAAENAPEDILEDEVLSEIDLAQSESEQTRSLALASDFHDSTGEFAEDADNLLELDDLFSAAATAPPPEVQTAERVIAEEAEPAKPDEKPEALKLPQSVIDEIVNRVVAQLSEKLTGELARRLAPAVADLVKQHQPVRLAAFSDSENLLDID